MEQIDPLDILTPSQYVKLLEIQQFIEDHAYTIPFSFIGLYLILIFIGPILVKNFIGKRELRPVVIFWNLFLSVMSFCVVVRVAGITWKVFQEDLTYGGPSEAIYKVICMPEPRTLWTNEAFFYVFFFALTKYLELFDTLLLIAKGKPVMFLHWYHHITVLLYTWFSYMTGHSAGWIFGLVNGNVHVIMYFYYFYATLTGTKPFWGRYITQLQLLQMVFGIIISGLWDYYYFTGRECPATHPITGIVASFCLYASYLLLFVQFYFKKYDAKKNK